jgi:hypothetical protein
MACTYREQRSPVAIPSHQPTEESGSAWHVRTESSAHQLPLLVVTSLQERVGQHDRYREQRSLVAIPSHQPTAESGSVWYREQRSPVFNFIPSHQPTRECVSMASTESSAHQLPLIVTSLQRRVGQHGGRLVTYMIVIKSRFFFCPKTSTANNFAGDMVYFLRF